MYMYMYIVNIPVCTCIYKNDVTVLYCVSSLLLRSERSSTPDHTHHRLSWCPCVLQEGEEEDGWMVAVSHGCEVRE